MRRDHRHGPGVGRSHRWTQQRTGGTGRHGNGSEYAVHQRSPSRQGTDGMRAGDHGPVPAARITSPRPTADAPPTRTRVRVRSRPEQIAPPPASELGALRPPAGAHTPARGAVTARCNARSHTPPLPCAAGALPVCGSGESSTVPRRDVPPRPSNSCRTRRSSPSRRSGRPRSSLSCTAAGTSAASGRPTNRTPPSPTASADRRTHGTTGARCHGPRPQPAAAGAPVPTYAATVRSEGGRREPL